MVAIEQAIKELRERPRKQITVDMSDFFGAEPGTWPFCLREPSVADAYQAVYDALALTKREGHTWLTTAFALDICLLGFAHVSPELSKGKAPAIFYAEWAARDDFAVGYLASEMRRGFPALSDFGAEIEERKKTLLGETVTSSASASGTSSDTLAS